MPTYLARARYTSDGWAAMVRNPHDRTATVGPLVEKLGGSFAQVWFTADLGELVANIELPDDQTMAQLAAAVRASGAVAELHCTRLIPTADAVELFQQAGTIDYHPPS